MESAKSQFDKISGDYDSQRPLIIPRFDDFYGTVENLLAEFAKRGKASPRAADLGAGTGIMSERVLRVFPKAKITLVDLSKKMLEIAQKKFSKNSDVNFLLGDFFEFNPHGEKFDIIVSALAIHHIENDEKIRLYKKIFDALAKGGIFINAEQILGESENDIAFFKNERVKLVKSIFANDESAINIARQRLSLDRCAKASEQIEWLKSIGFCDAKVAYSYLDFAVISAQKAL